MQVTINPGTMTKTYGGNGDREMELSRGLVLLHKSLAELEQNVEERWTVLVDAFEKDLNEVRSAIPVLPEPPPPPPPDERLDKITAIEEVLSDHLFKTDKLDRSFALQIDGLSERIREESKRFFTELGETRSTLGTLDLWITKEAEDLRLALKNNQDSLGTIHALLNHEEATRKLEIDRVEGLVERLSEFGQKQIYELQSQIPVISATGWKKWLLNFLGVRF